MTKDIDPTVNVGLHEHVEAWGVRRSQSATSRGTTDYHQQDEDTNDGLNLPSAKIDRIEKLNKKADIVKNSIFVLMTILSLSILVKEGSICISK